MILKLLVLFLLIGGIQGMAQINLKKFDKKKFDELKKNNLTFYFINDSIKIEFEELENNFYEKRINTKSLFSEVKYFDKKSKLLISETTFFQSNPIGVSKEYDSKGNVIKQINFDIHFSYSLDQLRADFISDFQIDIFDSHQKCNVIRDSDTDTSTYYQITQSLDNDKFRCWSINGMKGKIESNELIINEY